MATKTKKAASLEIVKQLRELVELANTDALDYKDFKKINDKLTKNFEIAAGSDFIGFSLSETFQLMWLDPDAYLTEGSFMQRWFASQKGVHPSDITEDTVATYIYTFLKTKFGDFKGVTLVSPMGLPQLAEMEGAASEVSAGMLLELSLAPGVSYRETGYYDPVHRQRRIDEPVQLITGERDAEAVDPTTGVTRERVEKLRGNAAQQCIERGEFGEITITDFRGNPPGARQPSEVLTDEHVQRYLYRDSTGEINEHNFTGHSGPSLSEMFSEIRGFEQALSERAASTSESEETTGTEGTGAGAGSAD
jgi:hypothetical protein